MKKIIALLTLFCIATFAQQQGSFTDPRDGKKYKTVKIGVQTWMAENLNYAVGGSKCYNDSSDYCKKYGRLYDWTTAMRACPSGWHLPSDDEWEILIDYVGIENAASRLKTKSSWNWNEFNNKSGNGFDIYGFAALPGGNGVTFSLRERLQARQARGYFEFSGDSGYWWTSSDDYAYAYGRFIVYLGDNDVLVNGFDKDYLFSIRCVKN